MEFYSYGAQIPLSVVEISYQMIQSESFDIYSSDQQDVELDQYSIPNWVTSPTISYDYLNDFSNNCGEVMALWESPWGDMHHWSSFLPYLERVEKDMHTLISTDIVDQPQSPILTRDVLSKGNLGNISNTI